MLLASAQVDGLASEVLWREAADMLQESEQSYSLLKVRCTYLPLILAQPQSYSWKILYRPTSGGLLSGF